MIQKNTLSIIDQYQSDFQEEKEFISRIRNFVRTYKDYYTRDNLVGHITGSAWIICPEKIEVLLIHHIKLNKWFQPGGHTESHDNTIADTAFREAKEETGIEQLVFYQDGIFDIDIHTIPAKKVVPEHLHYDIRFLFQAKHKNFSQNVEETSGIKWIANQDILDSTSYDQSLKRMAKKTHLL